MSGDSPQDGFLPSQITDRRVPVMLWSREFRNFSRVKRQWHNLQARVAARRPNQDPALKCCRLLEYHLWPLPAQWADPEQEKAFGRF